jgi:hypothetical protein
MPTFRNSESIYRAQATVHFSKAPGRCERFRQLRSTRVPDSRISTRHRGGFYRAFIEPTHSTRANHMIMRRHNIATE